MNRKFLGMMTGAVLTATVFAGCGGGGGGASSFQYDPPPGGPTPPAQKTINFTIPNYAAGDQAVVVFTPVSGDELDQATNTVQVTSSQLRVDSDGPAEDVQAAQGTALPDFCATDAHVRHVSDGLKGRLAELSAEKLRAREVEARFDGLPAGSTAELFIPDFSGNKTQVQKMLDDNQTVHCNILAEVVGGVPVVTPAQALRLAQVFDSTNPFDPIAPNAIGIYDRVRGYCGSEWLTNPAGGRDGDLRVNIVLLSSATMGGDTSFGAVLFEDILSASVWPGSNEGEFMYINAEFLSVPGGTDLENYSFYHTVSHELVHIIQMNTKVGRNGTFPNFDPNTPNVNNSLYSLWERRTMAEGFAETAATLAGFGVARALDFGATGGANVFSLDRINLFMGGASFGPFFPGAFSSYTLGDNFWRPYFDGGDPYGVGHLLGLYIVRNWGPEKWGELTSSPHVGLLNLNTVLGNQSENIFHGFNMALYISTLTNAPAQYTFPFFRLDSVNAVRPVKSAAAPQIVLLPGPAFASSTAANASLTQGHVPWSTVLLRFLGGNGNPLNFQVNLPIRARAGLVHESPAGTFSSVQAP